MSIAALAQQTRERVTTHSSRVLLMIVPQATEGVQATQKYFAKFLSFVAAVGFLALLGVHTLLAQDAFVLSELKLESKMIADQREAISRKMEIYSSPQALANQAAALGMSPSEDPTFLNLTQEMPVVTDESGITRG
jgi:multidrug efflux pump subunit AcrB